MNNDLVIPKHVAIIMDGNGRWATNRNLPRSKGHAAGSDTLNKLAEYVLSTDTEVLSVFAFSTENFKRSDEEVNFLMDLFIKKFKHDKNYFNKRNIKVVFSGRREPLRNDVYKAMEEITELTKNNTKGIFNICLNYGGQAEIVDAALKISEDIKNGKINSNDINEKIFSKYLYNDLPPIDFVIRTSGELRVSNFMLYQASYAEFYFPETLFPDFNEKEYDKAIIEFNKRKRRFGGYDKKS